MRTQQIMRLSARRGVAVAVLAAFAAPATAADSLSLDINDDAARLTWNHAYPARNMAADLSVLHHQDRGTALSAGFHITGNAASESRPVNAGIGGRLYYVDADRANRDGTALAVGGFFDAKLPNWDRVGFGGHLYYAPDVLGFGDLEELTDLSLHVSYSVVREGDIYLGVRNVKGDFTNRGDVTIDTGMFVGFRLNF